MDRADTMGPEPSFGRPDRRRERTGGMGPPLGEATGMTWQEALRTSLGPPGPLRAGDTAVVAASGGVDSTALLLALAEVAPVAGIGLHVAYLDHGWRPSRAAELVLEQGLALGLPVTVGRLPQGWAPDETSARRERRRFLRHTAALVGARAVFLGHQADDQAETVLGHLLRGSGSRGGGGMAESAEGFWLRPLLDVPKSVLRAYVAERGIQIEEDPTNAEGRHLRNWIRHDILPHIEGRLPGAGEALVRHARRDREDEAHFRLILDRLWGERVQVFPPGFLMRLEQPETGDPALAGRLAVRLLENFGRRPSAPQVEALVTAMRRGAGGAGRSLAVFPAVSGLWIGPSDDLPPLPEATVLPHGVLTIPAPLAPGLRATELRLPRGEPLVLRSRQEGDRLRHHTTKLKEILREGRIPAPFRSRVPVVAAHDGVVAVLGLWSGEGGEVEAFFDPGRRRFVVGSEAAVLK